MEPKTPKPLSSHRIKAAITTMLSIFLTVGCMGRNLLIAHKTTPTSTIAMIIDNIDIISF